MNAIAADQVKLVNIGELSRNFGVVFIEFRTKFSSKQGTSAGGPSTKMFF